MTHPPMPGKPVRPAVRAGDPRPTKSAAVSAEPAKRSQRQPRKRAAKAKPAQEDR